MAAVGRPMPMDSVRRPWRGEDMNMIRLLLLLSCELISKPKRTCNARDASAVPLHCLFFFSVPGLPAQADEGEAGRRPQEHPRSMAGR